LAVAFIQKYGIVDIADERRGTSKLRDFDPEFLKGVK
jgi:hypothetical protein